MSYKVVTAAKESLSTTSKKIVEVGHGIDTEKFETNRDWSQWPFETIEVLSVGRISRIKNYETLIYSIKKTPYCTPKCKGN